MIERLHEWMRNNPEKVAAGQKRRYELFKKLATPERKEELRLISTAHARRRYAEAAPERLAKKERMQAYRTAQAQSVTPPIFQG